MAYTEWTFQGRVLSWIREFIKEKNLPFDGADQEIIVEGRKRPDILVWKNRNLREAALLLSLKGPYRDAWEAADDALIASSRAGTRYFATWNVNRFFMWDRYRRGNLYDQLVDASEVTTIKHWREIDRVEESIRSFLRDFLVEFTEVYFERKALPPLPPDERFIFRLRSAIDTFSIPAFYRIKDEWDRSKAFREGLRKWFAEQGWTFTRTDDDFEKVARQYVYLLVNKIVFYYILRLKNSQLPKIHVPLGVGGEQFREILQSFFNQALGIDYETIFAADFLDAMPLPDDLTGQLRNFIDRVGEYDFSKVGYEVIGRVFERLIPERERHKLGQYFTRSDVVDLMVGFCVRSPDAKVLDPACGAGTFLVRSYFRKNFLDPPKPHEELLNELYGIDIAKFPAHLTTINLAARDLSVEENYPRVLCEDFFDVIRERRIPILKKEYAEKYRIEGLDLEKLMVKIPLCDAVVMNPPYTRQEEMESLVFPEGYRITLQRLASEEWDGFYVGKRSSIYSHFFFHGGQFLKEEGRLGLITSNSWLDVDYGKYLQEFFLQNFKIVAVIESKVERWFEDADINTAITILQKCREKRERDNNLVKFVQLKKPLSEFIPLTRAEDERLNIVEEFTKFIEETEEYFNDDKMRVYPIRQEELWKEGFDKEEGKYVGSKWGKYLRAPEIFFKILEKGKDIFIPLKEVADIRRGFTTGANSFFYLSEDKIESWKIEPKFLKAVIKSPKESETGAVNPHNLKYKVLLVHKDKSKLQGTNVLKYIMWGEGQTYHDRPTCSSRERWYDLGRRKPAPILWVKGIWARHITPYNPRGAYVDQQLYDVTPHDKKIGKILCALLNSTLTALFSELHGRVTFGEGVLWIATYEASRIPIVNPTKIDREMIKKVEQAVDNLCGRPIKSIFEEVNMHDRRELDTLIFNVIGLTKEEGEEVYKAVIDLVGSRIKKARSVKKRKKRVKGIDIEALVEDIFEEVGKGRLMKFPDDYIEGFEYREISAPEGEAQVGQDLYGFYVKIGGKEIRCKSPYEARYIQYAVLNGKTTIRIFKDEKLIREAVREYGSLFREVKKRIIEYLESTIPERKLRDKIKAKVWERIVA
ncbi:MAG: N-6 DNA methylase [Candidatus Bathyarchaeota archaeon]|nr:N-6 DNA methylase [Candidatus Bathyarchaeota archaeon]MDH5746309.1 N-6 DNA methylase [Candidatus Bathyarchaeota archaeon]